MYLAYLAFLWPAHAQYLPPSEGLVAWWRGERNGNDSSGNGHNASLLYFVKFATGRFGQAFWFNGSSDWVFAPDSPDFALTNSLSIGAWVFPTADSWRILERSSDLENSNPYNIGLNDAGQVEFFINSFSATDTLRSPISYWHWTQVTATLDGNTGDMRLYFNGSLVAQKFTAVRPGGYIWAHGPTGIGIGSTPGGPYPFIGEIDEVVLYSRALSPAEVLILADQSPPVILSQPQDKKAYVGSGITFSVTAAGGSPLNYLWYKDGLPLIWATDSTLALTNLSFADAGHYAVVVSNPYGLTASAYALLTVGTVSEQMGLYPGITIQGLTGTSFDIQYATNLSATAIWTTLTNLTLSQPSQLWVDTSTDVSSGITPRRYYRAVFVP